MPGSWGSRWCLTARPRRGPPSESPGPINQIGTEPPGTLRQEDARGLLSFFAPGSQQKRCFTALGMTAGGRRPAGPSRGGGLPSPCHPEEAFPQSRRRIFAFGPGGDRKRMLRCAQHDSGGKAPGPPEAGAFFAAFAPFPRGGGLFLPLGGVAPRIQGKLSFLSQSEEKCPGFSWKISTFCPLYFPTPSAEFFSYTGGKSLLQGGQTYANKRTPAGALPHGQ